MITRRLFQIINTLRVVKIHFQVDMYLCGHDHNVQHLRYFEDNDIDYVISGGGGALISRYIAENEDIVNGLGVDSLHFTASYSFAGSTFL